MDDRTIVVTVRPKTTNLGELLRKKLAETGEGMVRMRLEEVAKEGQLELQIESIEQFKRREELEEIQREVEQEIRDLERRLKERKRRIDELQTAINNLHVYWLG